MFFARTLSSRSTPPFVGNLAICYLTTFRSRGMSIST
jgi:hypothetical protein